MAITSTIDIRWRPSLANERSLKKRRMKLINKRSVVKSSNIVVTIEAPPPPLVTALKASAAQKEAATFHFPGHNRGRAAPSSLTHLIGTKPFLHDLPELPELDNLFSPQGPILDAQSQAAKLFGAAQTWFLVNGTTCGIQASIMATCSPGDYLILPRNSHLSTISALVLSGAIPKYIIPECDSNWGIPGGITILQVEKAIKELGFEGRKAAAIIITSPTYHGICSNLNEICQLCHAHGIPVIVDEAHGAHLGFHPQLPNSALQQGADLVVQSTHKVLCSLTQSSMLHMSRNHNQMIDRERICRCLQILQSSSPSYLLLASLDAARAQISDNQSGTLFNKAIELALKAKNTIKKIPGISVLDYTSFSKFPMIDPLRLTVGVWKLGLSGHEADGILYRDHEIISELVETKCITFAINLGTCEEHVERLVFGLELLSKTYSPLTCSNKHDNDDGFVADDSIITRLSPREAFFARKKKVSIEESVGMICGEMICPYPPGIPIMYPGEIITQKALNYLMCTVKSSQSKGAFITGASDPQLSSILVCNL